MRTVFSVVDRCQMQLRGIQYLENERDLICFEKLTLVPSPIFFLYNKLLRLSTNRNKIQPNGQMTYFYCIAG